MTIYEYISKFSLCCRKCVKRLVPVITCRSLTVVTVIFDSQKPEKSKDWFLTKGIRSSNWVVEFRCKMLAFRIRLDWKLTPI